MDGASAQAYARLDRAHLSSVLTGPGAADLSGCHFPQCARLYLRASSWSQVPCPRPGLPPQPGTSHPRFHSTNLCTLHTPTHHLYVAGPAAGALLPSARGCLRSLSGILEQVRCLLFSVRRAPVPSALLDFRPLGALQHFFFLLAWLHEIYDTYYRLLLLHFRISSHIRGKKIYWESERSIFVCKTHTTKSVWSGEENFLFDGKVVSTEKKYTPQSFLLLVSFDSSGVLETKGERWEDQSHRNSVWTCR